jgi:hypothetical protein
MTPTAGKDAQDKTDERDHMGKGFLNFGRALEDSFFHIKDSELLDEFRDHLTRMESTAQLADVCGIHDDAVLQRLVALNIGPETLAALTLVPLVEVAWADGKVDRKEHASILDAAEKAGMLREDDAFTLLDKWLNEKPSPEMMVVWKQYVSALCETLDGEAIKCLKHDLLDRARSVAEATGGLLGLGNRVTAEEKAVLDEMEEAFA